MTFDPYANLPRTAWTEEAGEEVVDYDILRDLLRDAAGAVTSGLRRELSSPSPRPEVVERLSDQKSRFLRSLRDLRIADTGSAEDLRNECLAAIREARGE